MAATDIFATNSTISPSRTILAWGYVDLAPAVATRVELLSRLLFGESMHALRLLPALALRRGSSAHRPAHPQNSAASDLQFSWDVWAVLLAPVIVNNASRFSMNPFEPLFWMGAVYFVLRAINAQPTAADSRGRACLLGLGSRKQTFHRILSSSVLFVGVAATSPSVCFSKQVVLDFRRHHHPAQPCPTCIWQYQPRLRHLGRPQQCEEDSQERRTPALPVSEAAES